MTITLNRTAPDADELKARDTQELESILGHALDAISAVDPDLLHSHTSAGESVIALANAARAAAAALGGEPGTVLRTAPGVVVVRDLVAAASALGRAATRCGEAADPLVRQRLARQLTRAHRRLLVSLPATT